MPGHINREISNVIVCWVRNNFFRRPNLDKFAIFHDGDVVPHFDRFKKIMSDKDHSFSHYRLKLEEFILHIPPDQWIERAKGLIKQHDLRIDGKGSSQSDPLLHAP